jgi:hypothetical protein
MTEEEARKLLEKATIQLLPVFASLKDEMPPYLLLNSCIHAITVFLLNHSKNNLMQIKNHIIEFTKSIKMPKEKK